MTKNEPKLPKEKSFISRNVYRPIPLPNIPLPFGLRSVGHCKARAGWEDAPYKKTFVQIFWIVSGSAQFTIRDKKLIVKEDECFVYFPGHAHLILALSDYFEYRWITIDGDQAELFTKGFGLIDAPKATGPCPISEFELLEIEILDGSPFGQARCSEMAFSLMSKFSGIKKIHEHAPVIEACLILIENKLHLSEMNVNMMAEELNIHRSQLTRQFKKELGMSPIEFLISRRVQKGLQLLEESRLTIKEVATLCGYQQPDYFAKAIRKMTGLRPGQIKKKQ